ncbi:hypothetical protein CN895_07730 [Bacillus cereus]|uniref:hypothetical protein n=1 Tax=Bacillus cereus TaxID=1396 RepID=UPI000BFD6C02|nr:hypothetical protein [Bacillus cereus]PGK15229.1 hypothetical protein CN895_07730 [Bacillus cereus]
MFITKNVNYIKIGDFSSSNKPYKIESTIKTDFTSPYPYMIHLEIHYNEQNFQEYIRRIIESFNIYLYIKKRSNFFAMIKKESYKVILDSIPTELYVIPKFKNNNKFIKRVKESDNWFYFKSHILAKEVKDTIPLVFENFLEKQYEVYKRLK